MKKYRVEILRRKSQFTEWYISNTIEIRAKNIDNAMKQLRKEEEA